MVRVVDFFQLFFSSRVVGGLGWCFPDSGVGRVFYQKLDLHPFRLRELRVTQRFLTVSSSFEEKNFFGQLSLAYRWNFSSIHEIREYSFVFGSLQSIQCLISY